MSAPDYASTPERRAIGALLVRDADRHGTVLSIAAQCARLGLDVAALDKLVFAPLAACMSQRGADTREVVAIALMHGVELGLLTASERVESALDEGSS